MNLLDLIFPKKCVNCGRFGSYLCGECVAKVEYIKHPVCPICQRQAIEGKTHPGCRGKYRLDGLIAAVWYKGPVKRAIASVKYKWVFDIGSLLSGFVGENMWRFAVPQNAVLVPVPLHKKRKNWRGFNQAELIADLLGRKFGVAVSDLLERGLETRTQVGLTKEERKRNIMGAFKLRQNFKVKSRKFILVDDVFTTGATMNEACSVLKRAGAGEVWGLVVAVG